MTTSSSWTVRWLRDGWPSGPSSKVRLTMKTFILVAGAWQGAGVWELIVPLLEGRGHRVIALELPAMGKDTKPLAEVTRAGWAAFVAAQASVVDGPVFLVGHSRGGLTITDAAQLAAARIAGLIYIASLPPAPGWPLKKLFGLMASHDGTKLTPRLTEDKLATTVDADQLRSIYYNMTPTEVTERAIASLRPEPLAATMNDPNFDPAQVSNIPRAYIECLHDRSIPIDVQRKMQEILPFAAVETLDSDHSPFYSRPRELAEALDRIAAKL